MTADERALSMREWRAWQDVCGALRAAGAVTQADLDAPANDDRDTPGACVFRAIRAWGEAVSDLAKGGAS